MADRKGVGGRPTDYRPEMCDRVIKVGREGGWLCEMAEECDVVRSTMDNWALAHPEFLEALTRAKQLAQAWFEHQARTNVANRDFNAALWKHQMAARHRGEYSEIRKLEHTSPDRSMTPKALDLSRLSTDALKAIAEAMEDEDGDGSEQA